MEINQCFFNWLIIVPALQQLGFGGRQIRVPHRVPERLIDSFLICTVESYELDCLMVILGSNYISYGLYSTDQFDSMFSINEYQIYLLSRSRLS